MIQKIKLKYNLDVFLNGDYTQHYGSCISYQIREQKDLHENNFPKSYDENNTRIQQIWFDDNIDVDYLALGTQLNMDIKTISAILQPPGNTVTLHRDTFFKFKSLYPDDKRTKVRANIYLEDWKPGHLIHYQDHNHEWQSSTHWKAGDGFLWDSSHLHLSGNCGLKDKYTLQISGFYNE
tara:strand:- start:80 stop:616 length:537 start_codon:yes stop_codon:yes gene_type:complete